MIYIFCHEIVSASYCFQYYCISGTGRLLSQTMFIIKTNTPPSRIPTDQTNVHRYAINIFLNKSYKKWFDFIFINKPEKCKFRLFW